MKKIQLNKPLNEKIWSELKEKTDGHAIKSRKLDRREVRECDHLVDQSHQIIENIGFKSRVNVIRTSLNGYTVRLLCNETLHCQTAWVLVYDLEEKTCSVNLQSKCEHIKFE